MIIEKIVLDSVKQIGEKILDKTLDESGIETNHIKNSYKNPNEKNNHNNSSPIGMINAYSRNKRLNIMVVGAAMGLILFDDANFI